METSNANNSLRYAQRNGSNLGSLQYLNKPILVLKGRLKTHIESSKHLEYLDEIKDLLHFLNELEHRYCNIKKQCDQDGGKTNSLNLKSELKLISKEIHLLQMAVDSVIEIDEI